MRDATTVTAATISPSAPTISQFTLPPKTVHTDAGVRIKQVHSVLVYLPFVDSSNELAPTTPKLNSEKSWQFE